jgi:hypothetical protein
VAIFAFQKKIKKEKKMAGNFKFKFFAGVGLVCDN